MSVMPESPKDQPKQHCDSTGHLPFQEPVKLESDWSKDSFYRCGRKHCPHCWGHID